MADPIDNGYSFNVKHQINNHHTVSLSHQFGLPVASGLKTTAKSFRISSMMRIPNANGMAGVPKCMKMLSRVLNAMLNGRK